MRLLCAAGGAWAGARSISTHPQKFDDAGIEVYGLSGFPGSTEAELARTFEIAEVLGARLITLGVTLPAARRHRAVGGEEQVPVGIQGNPNMNPTNPETIARPEQYEEAVSLLQSYGMSFDIGDATGGGYDCAEIRGGSPRSHRV
jgi:hypothetical protein